VPATLFLAASLTVSIAAAAEGWPTLIVDTPLSPPTWGLLQRALLRANTEACREFYDRYFDERGYLLCVERWGGDDGPDDAIENCNDWPLLHALGAPDVIRQLYERAIEGHLRQYTVARTVEVPFARDGMYFKEFPCMFDWQHNNEGLLVFHQQGLSDPTNAAYRRRVLRYAGFYMNEEPGAENYDPRRKVIRSLFNGSRGPLLRKATALDWTGDPIEVRNRFSPLHGERSYEEMLAHFQDYTDIVGDHPLNLLATSLPLHAFLLTGQEKYKQWLLEYVDAWRERMLENGGVIPSNIGLDGTIGGECDGKWYGGTYGWGFTTIVPQTGDVAHRNRSFWGFTGFMNAYLLTGDDKYLQPWRQQRDVINAKAKVVQGETRYPRMYGDEGWYDFQSQPYAYNDLEIYYLSMRADDRSRLTNEPWLNYLDGNDADYPRRALEADLARVRERVAAMRRDTTTPDTRLSDDPMRYNPASVSALRQLMLGGIDYGKKASVLHCRLRYFDPLERRAGIPADVAALVERMDDRHARLLVVNLNPLQARTVVIQAGGYGEHSFITVQRAGQSSAAEPDRSVVSVGGAHLQVVLQPGCGARLNLGMDRYVNPPTSRYPWDVARLP
jgi:hypothetical protein